MFEITMQNSWWKTILPIILQINIQQTELGKKLTFYIHLIFYLSFFRLLLIHLVYSWLGLCLKGRVGDLVQKNSLFCWLKVSSHPDSSQ